MTKSVLLLQASNKELNAKVDSLNKTIEANKKTKKELQVGNCFNNNLQYVASIGSG
jgi:hypothetical protein